MPVTYGSDHLLLTIRGQLLGSSERWGIGLRFNGDGLTQPAQATVDACEAPIRTWFTAVGTIQPNTSTVDEIKLAPIGTNGKYPPGLDSVVKIPSPAITGTTGNQAWPAQCAYVVTLTTPLPRGRGHVGRVYLPTLRNPFLTAGLMATSDVNALLAAFRTMILSLNGIAALGNLHIYSPLGPINPVTGFRGGVVPDTQRRRRRGLAENYQSLAL